MRSWMADYEIIGPVAVDEPRGGRAGSNSSAPRGRDWVARPPARLHWPEDWVVLRVAEIRRERDAEQLLARAGVLAGVRAPQLIELLEAGRDEKDGSLYVAMAPSSPETLARPSRPLDERTVAGAVGAAARGVHQLHEAGLVHGAISPARLVLSDRGPLLDPLGPLRIRPAGQVVGPDDRLDLELFDPALLWGDSPSRGTDIWSLGVTLHQVLTHNPLHPGLEEDAPATALQRVLLEPPTIDRALAKELADLVHACLAANPADRPATAAHLADRLDQFALRP